MGFFQMEGRDGDMHGYHGESCIRACGFVICWRIEAMADAFCELESLDQTAVGRL